MLKLTIMSFMQGDYDNSFMEEEDTDYVDIPIKVVTQSDIAAS